jgi:hypothetical protein
VVRYGPVLCALRPFAAIPQRPSGAVNGNGLYSCVLPRGPLEISFAIISALRSGKLNCTVLLGLLLVAATAAHAQSYAAPYVFTVNPDNSVTITGYDGPGGALIIPSSISNMTVAGFGTSAFSNHTNLTSVTIPDSVTDLPFALFAGDSSLTNVTVPGSVTNIGYGAFGECFSLPGLLIPQSVTSIGIEAFTQCTDLTTITLPKALTTIGNWAFQESGLINIAIPDSVTNISNQAFWYSSNLTYVTIGSGLSSIGVQVFSFCPSLVSFSVDSNNPNFMSAGGALFDTLQHALLQYPIGNTATSYVFPNSTVSIDDYAFLDCASLAQVTLDQSLTNIGGEAFANCSRLAEIAIPNSVVYVGSEAFSGCASLATASTGNGLTAIEYATFAECSNLTSVDIGTGVTNIGDLAFYFTGLTGVTIPNSVTSIGQAAFDSTSLTNLTIPDSMGEIGYQAFAGCTNLESLTLGNGLTNMDDFAFAGCTTLSAVTVGSSLSNLDYGDFADCAALTAINFEGNAPTAAANVFSGSPATAYYVPDTTGWSNFAAATGIPVAPWTPRIETGVPDFGARNGQFGFNITGPQNTTAIIQSCTNLAQPVWVPLQSMTLTNGLVHFSEPLQSNSPARFYRIGAP